jgi:hypothetical protein
MEDEEEVWKFRSMELAKKRGEWFTKVELEEEASTTR